MIDARERGVFEIDAARRLGEDRAHLIGATEPAAHDERPERLQAPRAPFFRIERGRRGRRGRCTVVAVGRSGREVAANRTQPDEDRIAAARTRRQRVDGVETERARPRLHGRREAPRVERCEFRHERRGA